jgi:HTH-type transcriptional regulator, competence development regulator
MTSQHGLDFGERVRALREQKRIGLRQFAAMAEMTPTYLSKIERGVFPPPAEPKIVAIAKALEADPDELLALANRVASDLTEIIREHPVELASFLRTVKGYSAEEILKLVKREQRRKKSSG